MFIISYMLIVCLIIGQQQQARSDNFHVGDCVDTNVIANHLDQLVNKHNTETLVITTFFALAIYDPMLGCSLIALMSTVICNQ